MDFAAKMNKVRHTLDYVVGVVDRKQRKRDIVISVETGTMDMPMDYNFYLASLLVKESKLRPGEQIVRVSVKGYS